MTFLCGIVCNPVGEVLGVYKRDAVEVETAGINTEFLRRRRQDFAGRLQPKMRRLDATSSPAASGVLARTVVVRLQEKKVKVALLHPATRALSNTSARGSFVPTMATMFAIKLFLAFLLPLVSALKFDLQAHPGHESASKERCIRNFVAKNQLVVVTTTVSGNRGDGMIVNMHVSILFP